MWKEKLLAVVNSLVTSTDQIIVLVEDKLTAEARMKRGEISIILMVMDPFWKVEKFNKAISDIMERWLAVAGEIINQQNAEWQEMVLTAVEGLVDDTKKIYDLAAARSQEGTDIGLSEWTDVRNYLEYLRERPSEFIQDLGGLKDAWVALVGKLAELPLAGYGNGQRPVFHEDSMEGE
jgi:hypothetical protein